MTALRCRSRTARTSAAWGTTFEYTIATECMMAMAEREPAGPLATAQTLAALADTDVLTSAYACIAADMTAYAKPTASPHICAQLKLAAAELSRPVRVTLRLHLGYT